MLVLTLLACGFQREPQPVAPILALTGIAAKGEARYQMTCANCHGASGRGVSRTPALAGAVHTYSDEALVDVMLNGRGAMTPVRLEPQPMADVLAYLRATWPD